MTKTILNFVFSICFISILFPIPNVNAGIERGNGGDSHNILENAAWFVDARKQISYCINIEEDFGINSDYVRKQIKKAVKTWQTYATKFDIQFFPKFSTSLNFVEESFCRPDTDLIFYFGTTNPQIQEEVNLHYRPYAFAKKLKYNMKKSWGKGYIWVAPHHHRNKRPDWRTENSLLGILLHEIGHVIGNAHIEGTIMSENITEIVSSEELVHLRSKIEHTASIGYSGLSGKKTIGTLGYFPKKNFKRLTHREPSGKIKVSLELKDNEIENSESKLILSDDNGSYEMHISKFNSTTIAVNSSTSKGFQVVKSVTFPNNQTEVFKSSIEVKPFVLTGFLTLPNQEKKHIILYRNFQDADQKNRSIIIRVLDDHDSDIIFLSEIQN